MPGVSFYLKNQTASRSKIYISVHHLRRYQKSTNLTVIPSKWNQKKNRTKNDAIINNRLSQIENAVWDLFNGGNFTELALDEIINPSPLRSEKFVDVMEDFIKKYRVAAATKKQYIHTKGIIERNWTRIDVSELDRKWHRTFIKWMITKNYQKNTAGARIKNLATVLNWASEEGYKVSPDYKKWEVFTAEKDIVFLTSKELIRLLEVELDEELGLSRDIHVLQSHLGQRYSEYLSITSDNIIDQKQITVYASKVGQRLKIPLSPTAKSILERYDWEPPKLDNTRQNGRIKLACKAAGITQDIVLYKHYLDRDEQVVMPKYKQIGTHTARRTFVTLSGELKIPIPVVMSITGHKEFRTVMKYYGLTDETNLREIAKWG